MTVVVASGNTYITVRVIGRLWVHLNSLGEPVDLWEGLSSAGVLSRCHLPSWGTSLV